MTNQPSQSAKTRATQLFLSASTFVRYVAFKSSPTVCLVDDIVNETFIYFTENADRWDLDHDVHALLQTITRNMARRQWRTFQQGMPEKLRELGQILITEIEQSEDISEKLSMEEELMALDLCLGKLSPTGREFVELHYYEGLSTADYAKQKGLNCESLRKALSRIRVFLRKCIQATLGTQNDLT